MPSAVMSTNRLEAFSDGVFAIVITLLVLDLRLPAELPGEGLWLRLTHIWPKVSAYAITFTIVGIYWVGHHGLFHLVKRIDKTLMWLNIYLLMAISFMPFPASIMGMDPTDPTAIRFYAGTLLLIGSGFIAIWTYAGRHLVDRNLDASIRRVLWLRVLIAPTVYGLAFLASYWSPRASLALFMLVPLLYIPPNRFDPRFFRA
ncbi:MAG TPA: TMEM175 family protein [Holophagaceae bacterium]|nr:TMEM175 family protein [Holophagaceae bacterium]